MVRPLLFWNFEFTTYRFEQLHLLYKRIDYLFTLSSETYFFILFNLGLFYGYKNVFKEKHDTPIQ